MNNDIFLDYLSQSIEAKTMLSHKAQQTKLEYLIEKNTMELELQKKYAKQFAAAADEGTAKNKKKREVEVESSLGSISPDCSEWEEEESEEEKNEPERKYDKARTDALWKKILRSFRKFIKKSFSVKQPRQHDDAITAKFLNASFEQLQEKLAIRASASQEKQWLVILYCLFLNTRANHGMPAFLGELTPQDSEKYLRIFQQPSIERIKIFFADSKINILFTYWMHACLKSFLSEIPDIIVADFFTFVSLLQSQGVTIAVPIGVASSYHQVIGKKFRPRKGRPYKKN